MKSRLLTKTDYRGNLVYYFGVPDIARRAGFGPYLDYIGPYTSEGDARQDEKRMIREASLILLQSRPKPATVQWAKDDREKRTRLRLEGYEACKTGMSLDACPYPYTDRTGYYWLLGWWKREHETGPDSLSSEILNLPQSNPRHRRLAGRKRRQSEEVTVTHFAEGAKTRLYFSFDPAPGSTDTSILQESGVDHLLVTYASSGETGGWPGVHKILCSQAPRHSLPDFDLEAYLEFIEVGQDEFDFAISSEVPGDSEATRTLWLKTTEWLTVNLGDTPLDDWPTILPVWGWGSSLDLLDRYLHESHLVAMGGSLPLLLAGQDRGVLQDLVVLCHQYQGRFHIHQCNWAAAVEQLLGLVHSIDTSMWQDGYQGTSISRDIKTGLLHMAPATVTPDGKGLSKHALRVRNAQNLKSFVEDPCNQVVSLSRCSVCGGVLNSKGTDRKYCTPGCAVIDEKDRGWRHVYCFQRLGVCRVPYNLLSKFLVWCLKDIGKDERVWYVATYADPSTSGPNGNPHFGFVYIATGWFIFCGISKGRNVEGYRSLDGEYHSMRKGKKTRRLSDIPPRATIIRSKSKYRYCAAVGPPLARMFRRRDLARRMAQFIFQPIYQLSLLCKLLDWIKFVWRGLKGLAFKNC